MLLSRATRLRCLRWKTTQAPNNCFSHCAGFLTNPIRPIPDAGHQNKQTKGFFSSMTAHQTNANDFTSSTSPAADTTALPLVPQVNRYTCRSHTCGELNAAAIGQSVTLCGWLQFSRMNKFLTLRDGYGATQVIVDAELAASIHMDSIPFESILCVRGRVRARPAGMVNAKMATGAIEVHAESVELLNASRTNLPMEVRGHNRAKEATRMEFRYVDLRFADMQRNLRMRSAILQRMREYLINHAAFVEVETPTLFRRTPGGAQEFVVPSRKAGHFYSLVQSPQQFKQMLMSGAVDRYFQVARCYRDESTRADRQPEFTQLDVELSFTDREGIMELVENLLVHSLPASTIGTTLQVPFKRMTYDQAMDEYGCDKPDTRFGMTLQNVTNEFGESRQDGSFAAYAIVVPIAPEHKYPSAMITELHRMAGDSSSKFEVIRLNKEPEKWVKYNKVHDLSADEVLGLFKRLGVKRNDTICLAFGAKIPAQTLLGRIRLAVREHLEHANILPLRPYTFDFLWLVDFPMFSQPDDPSAPLETVHHPFTAPHPDDAHLLHDPTQHTAIRSQSYDLVLNGQEVGGGSIRIHQAHLQRAVLDDILRIDHSHLGHLLDALASGCPPHGGIALGIDRLMAIVCGTSSLRDVIAFPKGADGRDALSKAPVPISREELDLYHIEVKRE